MPTLLTIGHGTLPVDDLGAILHGAGVTCLVDIRSFPGSRRNPQFGRGALETWAPSEGIAYHWDRRLGGRRRPDPASPHVALRHPSFRAYADHMDTGEFREAVAALVDRAEAEPTAVMCSESVWWRCHRRLVADHVTLLCTGVVEHLMHDGRRTPHRPTPGARVDGDRLVYDVADPPTS